MEGIPGTILTLTDARGIELENTKEDRVEPVPGNDLVISLDYNIQMYAQQEAEKVMEAKGADYVSILILNPQNGEIYACANVPEFDLNDPFTLNTGVDTSVMTDQQKQDALNQMWRNQCVNDTYEPGSTFKIFTSSAALLTGTSKLTDQYYCPGYKIVEDRRIRCHKAGGHGSEDFTKALENSCNPALMEMGLRMGVDRFYQCFSDYGLLSLTGIDIPGEAGTIMHKLDNIGEVELATMTFGQSFQITPVQLAVMASSVVNGGRRITPHLGGAVQDQERKPIWKATGSVERQQLLRPCLEVPINIFLHFLDLHQPMIHRCWPCALSMILRASTTVERSVHLWCGQYLKIFYLIWGLRRLFESG